MYSPKKHDLDTEIKQIVAEILFALVFVPLGLRFAVIHIPNYSLFTFFIYVNV